MARREENRLIWPLGAAVACFALAVGSPVVFHEAWDAGFVVGGLALLVGVVFAFIGRVGRAPTAGAKALRPGQTLWWPFAVAMGFFGIAVTAPFPYRTTWLAGLLVAVLATVGAVAMMYLGKLLMRARRGGPPRG